MVSIRLYEISREFIEMTAEIFGSGSAAAQALKEAEKHPGGARFFKSRGSIIVTGRDGGIINGGEKKP